MRNNRAILGAALSAALCAHAHDVFAQEFHVDRDAVNLVRFISNTTLDEFEGTTNRIDGYALLSETESGGASDRSVGRFYFEVELASIDTGIGLRNRHMRDNYLEVEKFPYAVFAGEIASVDSTGDSHISVTGSGAMAIHGVERNLEIVCAISSDGARYRSRCEFEILLSDFEIRIPKVMFLKLANEIRLELDFVMKPAGRN